MSSAWIFRQITGSLQYFKGSFENEAFNISKFNSTRITPELPTYFGKWTSRLSLRCWVCYSVSSKKYTFYVHFWGFFPLFSLHLLRNGSVSRRNIAASVHQFYSVWNIDDWASVRSDISKYLQYLPNFALNRWYGESWIVDSALKTKDHFSIFPMHFILWISNNEYLDNVRS